MPGTSSILWLAFMRNELWTVWNWLVLSWSWLHRSAAVVSLLGAVDFVLQGHNVATSFFRWSSSCYNSPKSSTEYLMFSRKNWMNCGFQILPTVQGSKLKACSLCVSWSGQKRKLCVTVMKFLALFSFLFRLVSLVSVILEQFYSKMSN